MSRARSAFQEWRRRLEDLQASKTDTSQPGWVGKLHARVLRYFISRYEYQPIPQEALRPPQPRLSETPASQIKLAIRLQEENESAHLRGEDCRELLTEIKSCNAQRKRFSN